MEMNETIDNYLSEMNKYINDMIDTIIQNTLSDLNVSKEEYQTRVNIKLLNNLYRLYVDGIYIKTIVNNIKRTNNKLNISIDEIIEPTVMEENLNERTS